MACFLFYLFSVSIIEIINCYDQYQEGFYNSILPGSDGDSRHFPSTPFSTDVNRYADGFTSTGNFDVTSPHFPLYNGSLSNVEDRVRRYISYMRDADFQGVAGFGEGDARREDARVKLLKRTGEDFTNFPAPTKVFPVYASIKWNPSDYAIQVGEEYEIQVGPASDGATQLWMDGGIKVDAEGYTSYYDAISNCMVGMGRCRSHLKKRRRLVDANWMSLACAIGQFVRPVQEVEPGNEQESRFIPLDESTLQETIFKVGKSVRFTSKYTGQLICFANDAHTLYWNNVGKIDVTVTRVSWPPKKDTYYKARYKPACDSAIAVYKNRGDWTSDECNPDGGGAGWDLSDVLSTTTSYGSGGG